MTAMRVLEHRGIWVAALATAVACGCSDPAASVVSQQLSSTISEPSFGGTTDPQPDLEPITPVEPTATWAERNCATPEACTACESDVECRQAIGSLNDCAAAACVQGMCAVVEQDRCTLRPMADNVLCGVGGPAGRTVSCDIMVVRENADVAFPEGVTVDLAFPHHVLALQGFEQAPGAGYAPPATLQPFGHIAAVRPTEPSEWTGRVTLGIYPPLGGTKVLTTAYDDGGRVIGNPVVVRAVFELEHPTLAAVWVRIGNARLLGPYGQSMETRIHRGTIVAVAADDRPCPGGACDQGPAGQQTHTALCDLTGAAGDTRDCLFQIVRGHQHFMPVSALEATVQYDATKLDVMDVFTSRCYAEQGCFDVALTAARGETTASGHHLLFEPGDPALWNGAFSFAAINLHAPSRALSDAYLGDDGELSADPVVAWVRFRLTQDVPPEQPAHVDLLDAGPHAIMATDLELRPVAVEVRHGMILTGAPTADE